MSQTSRVLVPIANPQTAPELLQLGAHLVDSANGGQVLALYVHISGRKEDPETLEKLRQLVEGLAAEGLPVELVERSTLTPERGILDASRELNADLIVLGFKTVAENGITLSPTIEAVAQVCRIPLLIYRSIVGGEMRRILVPISNSAHSQVAMQHAVLLGRSYGIPVKAVNVVKAYTPPTAGNRTLSNALSALSAEEQALVEQVVVQGSSIVDEIEALADDDTLIILGFTQDSNVDQWLFGPIPRQIMADIGAPTIIVRRPLDDQDWAYRLRSSLLRFTPVMTLDEQEDVLQEVTEMGRTTTNYLMLIMLSAALATFGLLQNSAAVIIGAMLVAPLMSPLMGFGVGMAKAQLDLMQRAFITLNKGVLLALLTSALLGYIVPLKEPTAEMLARGEPNLLDMGVAFAAGIAAAFAIARKDIPAAIAGVAIAAALMPPVCTVGLALAFGEGDLLIGSSVLVILNLLGISLAAFLTFTWMGMRVQTSQIPVQRLMAFVGALVVLGLVFLLSAFNASGETRQQVLIRDSLQSSLEDFTILEFETVGARPQTVIATIRGERAPRQAEVRTAEEELRATLDEDVNLEIVLLRLYTPPEEPTASPQATPAATATPEATEAPSSTAEAGD